MPFQILTPVVYFLIAAIWMAVLYFCAQRLLNPKGRSKLFATMMFVLALEAFRTVSEGLYFGIMRSAQAGFLPKPIYEFLIQHQFLIMPKLLTLLSGVVILFLLYWLLAPQEIQFWEDQLNRIRQLESTVNEVRRAEASVRESEERYSVMIRQTGQLVYEYNFETGRVMWYGAMETITGYSQEEADSLDIAAWADHIHPDHREKAMDLRTESMENQTPFFMEYLFRRKDGSYRWIEDNGVFIKGKDGKNHRLLKTMKDIEALTRRTESKDTLDKYEQIVSASQDFMALINRDYVYEAVNNQYCRFFDLKRNEIVGSPVSRVVGKAMFQDRVRPHLDRVFAGETLSYSLTFDRPGSGKRVLDMSYAPYLGDNNIVTGVVVNGRDVTEARAIEKHLQQTQKYEALGTLAGGVAHDFNNILGAIIGYTQLSQMNIDDKPKVRECVDQIYLASKRAKDLVQQILAFSRQTKTEKIPIEITTVVREVLKLIRASIPATIEIRQNVKSNLGAVKADQTQIHQIVMNLCMNAFHAMEKEGGYLDVSLNRIYVGDGDATTIFQGLNPGWHLNLNVTDTGHGMDKETLSRIFEPYFTTKDPGEGTGMGLATVHGIVKDHGGVVRVYSELGIGTSFYVYFPIIEEQTENLEETTFDFPRGKERILFVDDEECLAELGREILQNLGYLVEAKVNPLDALEVFQKRPEEYDVIITDLTMPKMTGRELTVEMRKIRSNIPIILCTGHNRKITYEDCRDLDLDQIMIKPLTVHDLAYSVRQALEKSPGLDACLENTIPSPD